MSGSSQAFPLGTPKDAQELLNRIQQQLDEFYQERVGGAMVGDVFSVPNDEVLTLNVHPSGGLQKVGVHLAILVHPLGALATNSEGIGIAIKANGALRIDTSGIYVYPSEIKLDDLGTPDNNTDLDATAARHGLLPKLSGAATDFLTGTGIWSVPAGAGDVVGPAGVVGDNVAEFSGATGKVIKDSGVTHAQLSGAVSATHARSHALDGTSDHSIGSLTNTYLVKSDGSKLVPATNTDADVSDAVTKRHAADDAATIEAVQDNLGTSFLVAADAHLVLTYSDVANTLTMQVIHNIFVSPVGIEFGSTTQEYDVSGTTWVSAVAGGTLGGIPDETSVGYKLANCLAAILTSRDGAYLAVREKTGAASATNPMTVQFLFTGVTAFDTIEMRMRYVGSSAHTVAIQMWNYTSGAWDEYASFSTQADYVSFTLHLFSPTMYLSGGAAKLQVIHQSAGTATHYCLFDYVTLNDGGGGGGTQVAACIPFTPVGGVSATNVQAAIEEVDSEKTTLAAVKADADVASAISLKHAAVTVTDTTTVNMTLAGQDVKGDVNNYWTSATSVADDGTVTGPTVAANFACRGTVVASSSGVIDASCEFEVDSTGSVTLLEYTGNVTYNEDYDGKLCIGTSVANPIIIKNRLGGSKNVLISVFYA